LRICHRLLTIDAIQLAVLYLGRWRFFCVLLYVCVVSANLPGDNHLNIHKTNNLVSRNLLDMELKLTAPQDCIGDFT